MRRFDFVRLFMISIVISHASALKSRGRKNFKKSLWLLTYQKKPYSVAKKSISLKELILNSVEISGFFYHSDFMWNQFWESRSSKMLLFAILGALSFVNLENFSLQKVKNFMKFKMNSLWIGCNARFLRSYIRSSWFHVKSEW